MSLAAESNRPDQPDLDHVREQLERLEEEDEADRRAATEPDEGADAEDERE